MVEFGKNAGFIWAGYAVTLLVIIGLIAWVLIDGRRQRAQLKELEARGIRRRSSRGAAAAPASTGTSTTSPTT